MSKRAARSLYGSAGRVGQESGCIGCSKTVGSGNARVWGLLLMPRRTSSGKKTKIASFEDQVKGTMPAHEMYAIANKEGLMDGPNTTARGRKAAKSEGDGHGAIAVHTSMANTGMFDAKHKRKF
jgi:hypothetical protein